MCLLELRFTPNHLKGDVSVTVIGDFELEWALQAAELSEYLARKGMSF